MRFDFSHHAPATRDELWAIEEEVNRAIWANIPVQTYELPYDEAIERGAMALFGEKYGNIVRMVEGVQLGTLEALVAPMDFYAGIDSKFGVFSIPVLFKDKTNASKTLLDPELNNQIRSIGADKNVVTISVFPHSTAHYFGKKPISRLADFKGLKLRVNATPAER